MRSVAANDPSVTSSDLIRFREPTVYQGTPDPFNGLSTSLMDPGRAVIYLTGPSAISANPSASLARAITTSMVRGSDQTGVKTTAA